MVSIFTLLILFSPFFALPFTIAKPTATKTSSDSSETAKPVVITTGPTKGGVQPRRDIRLLSRDKYQWNIFILALFRFQNAEPRDADSYYELAGIHAAAFGDWNGIGKCKKCVMPYYCAHENMMFAPWHRPYLALMEQMLQKYAIAEAKLFARPERAKYLAAAEKLKLPYWDWAVMPRDKEVVPWYLTDENIMVTVPEGYERRIANPLYGYENRGRAGRKHIRTNRPMGYSVRYPGDGDESDMTAFAHAMVQAQPGLQRDIWYTLRKLTTFEELNTAASAREKGLLHLESIHNDVHVLIGGPDGDMSSNEYAAADPIFWLHHANIDRYLTMWQILHPRKWIKSHKLRAGTYVLKKGQRVRPRTDLKPFLRKAGIPWTVEEVRDVARFGYTYDDIFGDAKSQRNHIDDLYKHTRIEKETGPSQEPDLYSWFIRLNKAKIQDPISIFVYLSPSKQGASAKDAASDAAGSASMLGGRAMPDKAGKDWRISGSTLMSQLEEAVANKKLKDLSNQAVAAFLQRNMSWRIYNEHTSKPIDPKDCEALLWVTVTRVDSKTGDLLPNSQSVIVEATKGKSGGLSDKDQKPSSDSL